jgi:hypothetical protein
MSKDEQEKQHRITLPIEWHVPDSTQNKHIDAMIIQHEKRETTVFFLESKSSPYAGSPEANAEYLQKPSPVRFECVGKMTMIPQLISQFIKALQIGLDNYNALKAREERDTNVCTFTVDGKTSNGTYICLSPEQASTSHSDPAPIDTSAGVDLEAQGTFCMPSYTIEEIDELEWDNIVSRPSAQRGLSRLAAEIRRQIAAGEIEEGGFAVE